MTDYIMRALAKDTGIQIVLASTTGLVEHARTIHKTMPTATAALGRTLTVTSMMGSQLKADNGSVTVQIKGDGPLGTVVAVGESDGYVRGYLQNAACDLPLRADGKLHVGGGIGRGYLMVIKDVGMKEPITGTTILVNGEIAEDLTQYFVESEQIPSACALGVLVDIDQSVKCAGGYLVQIMPGVTEVEIARLEQNLASIPSMTNMLDEGMTLENIAQKVLEGFTVQVLEKSEIGYRCACSEEKVIRALISMGREELTKMAEEEAESEVTCQFCDRVYRFGRDELFGILDSASSQ